MDIINDNNKGQNENRFTDNNDMWQEWEASRKRGKVIGGLIVIVIGVLFLLSEIGWYFPGWLFSWPMILIVIGVYSGFKHSFKNVAWLILILLGTGFLIHEWFPYWNLSRFMWPIGLILIGAYIIVKPKRNFRQKWERWERSRGFGDARYKEYQDFPSSSQDKVEINAIFGGVTKNITSKQFKGGEVNAIFGGAELNLTQADIQGVVELEMNQIFGGSKLIVPSHWEVKSELTAVLGSVEDKRPNLGPGSRDAEKVLLLRGNAVFGGLEIQCYA